ncbi:MAG: glycosyltransferase family 39 protein [Pirellulales bacterium]
MARHAKIADVNSASRWSTSLEAAAVTGLCAALLLATAAPLAMVWDEGDTIVRAEQTAAYVGMPLDDRADDFQARADWPYTTVREGHPPLAGLLIAAGLRIAPAGLDPLTRARLGPLLFFAVAAGAMYYRLLGDYRVRAVGVMAVVALLTMPRVFAHAHYATLDGPVTAAWVLTWAAFAPACRSWRFVPLLGLALGLAFSAKFTGWLAVVPLAAWAALFRDRRAAFALIAGGAIALVVFVLLNPPLWHEPWTGLRTFWDLNLHRANQPRLNVTTQFFGHMYDLDHPLPWYNSLVWTLITVTPIVALLGMLGIVASVRRWRSDPAGVLLVCNWATLVVVRALPIAPPHDAERLMLPSFAFFAALAGVGLGRGLYRDSLLLPDKIPAQGWAKVAMALAIAAATFDTWSYFPHNLSYYSRLVGGLRGATALGLEPTYYWDALDRTALRWIEENTTGDDKVAFGAAPSRNLELLKGWGRLRHLPADPGHFRWYVIQRRPSAHTPADLWLIEHEQPAFQRSISGVALLDIYSFQQRERALRAVENPDGN